MVMRRVFSYIRFSRPEQLKGDSLRRQMKCAEDYCAKHGLTLDDSLHLRDLGVSAFRGKNATKGALGGFLEAIKLGKVPSGSVLIVENLDRLSRAEMLPQLGIFTAILQAGVTIVTTNPEREYTQASVNDGFGIMEAIVHMVRAHDESARKSERLRQAWGNKRAVIGQKKLTAKIPFWLSLRPDRTGFATHPERVAVVKRIFEDAANGAGVVVIAGRLNHEEVPTYRKTPKWSRSILLKLLNGRTVLGELHPHLLQDGKRVPLEPIPDYYPRVISDTLYHQVQQGLNVRTNQRGPRGSGVTNLFTGLLFSGIDGTTLNITNKGKLSKGKRLVPSGALRGEPGSRYRTCSYQLVEDALLRVLKELKEEDVKPVSDADPVADIEAQLASLDGNIEKTKRRADSSEDIGDAVLDLLQRLSQRRKALASEREKLLRERSVKPDDALTEAKSIIGLMKSAEGEERERLRERLRGRLANLLLSVVVTPAGEPNRGILMMLIRFRHEDKERTVVVDEATGQLAAMTMNGFNTAIEGADRADEVEAAELSEQELLQLGRSILELQRASRSP